MNNKFSRQLNKIFPCICSIHLLSFIIYYFFVICQSSIVQINLSTSNLNAGKLADYTFTINRNISVTGATITPSPLTNTFYVQIQFSPYFNISESLSFEGSTVLNFSIDSLNNIIKIVYTSNRIILPIKILNITNPLMTNIYQQISIKIKNQTTLNIVDQSQTTLNFVSTNFNTITQWNKGFTPGNVSTMSNFTFIFSPDIWQNGKMYLILGFNRYWRRSLQNLTSNTVLSSSSKCEPSCTISNQGNFIQLQFSEFNITSNGEIQIKIMNIISPPTLQQIDLISIQSYENRYLSTVNSGQFTVSASKANSLQLLQISTNNQINQPISLSIKLSTSNIFGPNDTISIRLDEQYTSSSLNIQLSNGIVSSYSSQLISLKQLLFFNFNILTSTFSRMTFDILLINSINPQRSSKSILNNKIQIKRNGYLYNEQYFNFNVQPIINKYKGVIVVSNLLANYNSTMNLKIKQMSEQIISSDKIIIKIPKQIIVYDNTCVPIQCIGCICKIQLASTSLLYSTITINKFPASSIKQFSLNISIKNPLPYSEQSSLQIQFQHQDESSSLIEFISSQFPQIKQSVLSSSIINFINSNQHVYEYSNYTIIINLTLYDLVDGYMLLIFQQGIHFDNQYLVEQQIVVKDIVSQLICSVNNQPVCDLYSNLSTNQLVIRIPINIINKVYNVTINNIRNPRSTRPFQFTIEIFSQNINQQTGEQIQSRYYKILSQYYKLSKAYNLTKIQYNLSICQNSKSAILSLNLSAIPFTPSGIIVDNLNDINTMTNSMNNNTNNNRKIRSINKQILFIYPITNISITNHYSLQPYTYSLLMKTTNLLYDIFNIQIEVKNCRQTQMNITNWNINGLLGDQGYINIIYANSIIFDYLIFQFPIEYSNQTNISSNANSVLKLSPRRFKLIYLNYTYPLTIKIWAYIHNKIKSAYFKLSTYALSKFDNKDYLIATNDNTIFYNLQDITDCIFPCKRCTIIEDNTTICLQCYSNQYTTNYLLTNNTCSSTCPSGTYQQSSQCKPCPSQCLSCDLIKCFTCQKNYYLFNGTCVTDCPQKYYPITINQTCSNCIYSCEKCINQSFCLSCVGQLYLTLQNKCVTSCDKNELAVNSVCRKCQSPCQQCSIKLDNCTKCTSGYYLLNNTCVSVCISPLVASVSNNVCTVCSSICLTCITTPDTCTSCSSPYKLSVSKCLSSCSNGYYQQSQICYKCRQQCSTCSSQFNCTSCSSTFKLFNNSCLYLCPLRYFATKIISSILIFNNTQICRQCGQNCIQCTSIDQCIICNDKYYLFNDKVCVDNCPITMYNNVNVCNNCSQSCLYCVNEKICQICSSNTYLYNNKCIIQCPNRTQSFKIKKNISNTNYINSSQLYTFLCVQCSSIYLNCQLCSSNQCTKCVNNFVLDKDYKCKLKCQQNNYINLNELGYCVKCDTQCNGCHKLLNNCTQCNQKYFMNLNYDANIRQCVSQCPIGMIKYNNQCVSCNSPCRQCQQSPNKCLSCVEYIYNTSNSLNSSNSSIQLSNYILFNYSCIRQCPQYYYKFQKSCIKCEQSCQKCNKYGCQQCRSGYYTSQIYSKQNENIILYHCYSKCPNHIPFIKNNTMCTKCSQNCVSCNQNYCLQCEQDYYIYKQYCTKQCPLPLVLYSKSCVNQSDIPNKQQISSISSQSIFYIPVPFTLSLCVVIIVCIISKLRYIHTFLSISTYGFGAMLCIICNLYYFVTYIIIKLEISSILLLISILINYIINAVFIIFIKFTLFRDVQFSKFIITQKISYLIFIIGLLTTHTNYVIFFTRLFDFSIFKAHLQNIHTLRVINYLWTGQILVFIFTIIAAIIKLIDQQNNYYLTSQSLLNSIDLILINFIMFFLSILNFKKSKQIYLKDEDILSTQSTKKVIFDQSSQQNIYQFDSRQEIFDTKAKNFKIANQDYCQGLLPEWTGTKFTQKQQNNHQDHNYDQIFAENYKISQFNQQNIHNKQENLLSNQFIQKQQIRDKQQQQQQQGQTHHQYQFTRTIDLIVQQNKQKVPEIIENQTLNQQQINQQIQRFQQQKETSKQKNIFLQIENEMYQHNFSQKQYIQNIQQQLSKVSQMYQLEEQHQQKQISFKQNQKDIQTIPHEQRQLSDQKTRIDYSINNQQTIIHRNQIKTIEESNKQKQQNQTIQNNKINSKSQKKLHQSFNSPKKINNKLDKNKLSQSSPKLVNSSLNRINRQSPLKNTSENKSKKSSRSPQIIKSINVNNSPSKLSGSINQIESPQKVIIKKNQAEVSARRYSSNSKITSNKKVQNKKYNQFFIPGYLFAQKNNKSIKFKQQTRISGIDLLFKDKSPEKRQQIFNKSQIITEEQISEINLYKNQKQFNTFQRNLVTITPIKQLRDCEKLQNDNNQQLQFEQENQMKGLQPQKQMQFENFLKDQSKQIYEVQQKQQSNNQNNSQQQQDLKFYLRQPSNHNTNSQSKQFALSKLRKSKSFSPSKFKNQGSFNDVKDQNRYKINNFNNSARSNKTISQKSYRIVSGKKRKQTIQKQINKNNQKIKNINNQKSINSINLKSNNKSLHNSRVELLRPLQFGIIDYQKQKKSNKIQLKNVLQQIQRKDKIRAQTNKISRIYGNKQPFIKK